jgi:CHAD domain-containing protein
MSYRLKPRQSVHQGVKRIAAAQIEDLLDEHGNAPPSPTSVHEARKALKRLRALLNLIRMGLNEDDLEREKQRLRDIAGSLAGARDAQVMVETASTLQNGEMPRAGQTTARVLMTTLEKRRDEAEEKLADGHARLPVHAFREAQDALETLPLGDLGLDEVLEGFTKTYQRGRKLHAEIAQGGADDERFHDLRKQVQQHWRHLQLFCNVWPKMLRPQIALAHELAETLGKDHDLSVLAAYVRDNAGTLGPSKGVDAYLRLCEKAQEKLRSDADLLGRRLYAEKPKAIRERMRTYWQTARELSKEKGKGKAAHAGNSKALVAAG